MSNEAAAAVTWKAEPVVCGDLVSGVAAQIADGYHRVCASYHLDENTDIPCRIVAPRP